MNNLSKQSSVAMSDSDESDETLYSSYEIPFSRNEAAQYLGITPSALTKLAKKRGLRTGYSHEERTVLYSLGELEECLIEKAMNDAVKRVRAYNARIHAQA